MENEHILDKIKNMSEERKKNIPYEELVDIINKLSKDEIIQLSNIIGYPVFTRMCMGTLSHKFVLLQDGAAAIIRNEKGEILLQSRQDRDKWGIPGGCQELGETFEETVVREVKEETNLDVELEDLKLIDIVSGNTRRNDYPNGDVVINNTALYLVDKYSGDLKWDTESKEMKFFKLDSLPKNIQDFDLIQRYIKFSKDAKD